MHHQIIVLCVDDLGIANAPFQILKLTLIVHSDLTITSIWYPLCYNWLNSLTTVYLIVHPHSVSGVIECVRVWGENTHTLLWHTPGLMSSEEENLRHTRLSSRCCDLWHLLSVIRKHSWRVTLKHQKSINTFSVCFNGYKSVCL